ncbi:MAG: hypothetical protein J5I98_07795 [Phaeodactylibacter sp.]|nr:hypothetical protein [Phaeodactylibacter sp.]
MNTSSVSSKSILFQPAKRIFSALYGCAAYLAESFLQWVEAGYPEEAAGREPAEGDEEGMPEDMAVPNIYFFPYFYL